MRVVAAGSQPLMDGFALLGVETHADIDSEELERVLDEIVQRRQRTLLYLQQDLAQADLPLLQQIRKEGGNILISEIPPLNQPDQREATIDSLISRVLGSRALEQPDG
jgi:vacuolar-type H+-ATPase subunit F/Vma7